MNVAFLMNSLVDQNIETAQKGMAATKVVNAKDIENPIYMRLLQKS